MILASGIPTIANFEINNIQESNQNGVSISKSKFITSSLEALNPTKIKIIEVPLKGF